MSAQQALSDATARGAWQGRRLRQAINHNLGSFFRKVDALDADRDIVREVATDRRSVLPRRTRAEIAGLAAGAKVPFVDLLAFNLFEEVVLQDGCTVAIATGTAASGDETIFFKQSDKKGSEEFTGEHYSEHQQINVIRVEDHPGQHKIISVTPAGATTVKMGINDQGVAIGANISRTVTFDEDTKSDPKEWAAASRGEYMRRGLSEGSTAIEVAEAIIPLLYEEPMSSPGNIDIADADQAVIIEGEYTNLASNWIRDDVVVRTNKFEILKDLARTEDEIPSSYRRFNRVNEVLTAKKGEITVGTMRDLSIDHSNGPGLESICRHQEQDYTDETSLSSAIFRINGEDPAMSELYIALGKPCHAWRSEERAGWLSLRAGDSEEDIPVEFLTGEAWLDHYTEEPYQGNAIPSDLS